MSTAKCLRQANGAKQYLTVGIVFQRSLLVTTVVSLVLVLPVWLNIGQILTHLGAVFTSRHQGLYDEFSIGRVAMQNRATSQLPPR
jgi:Na+-driven multidrug efflux pump